MARQCFAFWRQKRRSGLVQRQAQAAMRAHLEGAGFPYPCTDDVDLAIEWLKDAGILRGGFQVQ